MIALDSSYSSLCYMVQFLEHLFIVRNASLLTCQEILS
uniref:Uncharacterized protein n=1 Tax=Rhizophora mucronata TaxID=61149 RepID=A0A2P2NES4_RHIMU